VTHFKLLAELERDIRNQAVIDQMKRLNRKQKAMIYVRTHIRQLALILNFVILAFLILGIARAFAENAPLVAPKPSGEGGKIQCPDPGVKCKVIYLNQQEEQMLMVQNGILDTAAQGRALELGQFSVYLKTRIGNAPQGEVKAVPTPAAENKPAVPVDSPPK
jgi:hypothetical protein